ncbi:BgTH12-02174 [Blumeria graminis f. sp. triticale]|uniref:B-related factor 1 n=1 Tax=Blumeria graminis f. sp. triticale TaxID=1689686 RepID=A0A9W4DHN3_BLUGR|nr:BgTH12-02174 [Blumeria graminis f. sp. triticale]
MGPPRPMMTPNRRPNPIRDRKPIVPPQNSLQRQAVMTAAKKAGGRPPKSTCKNPDCTTPDVIEGICHSCGLVMDDSNIVSEITFGESSSGAAVVHGSFVGEDQGAARSMGTAFRRAGGSENRENTINEGRRIIDGLGHQLGVVEFTRTVGLQIFKLAAMNNFIQGRRMDMVAAVCLYSACRKADRCRVMLIDFADKIQVNVFKLGRTFKALHRAITIAKDGIMPILPEDLIWRFASLLDFDTFTNKVADDAIRMAQRMSLDWMLMGRRPSGVCGACLILAARMNNFRRTVTEVVYVVKVTTATIQKRLEEFKLTPTSSLTVDEFVNNEFLETAHDPPSFYKKTEEFQKSKKQRKRKRMQSDDDEEDEDENEDENESNPSKIQKIGTVPSLVDQDQAFTTALVSTPVLSFDANGFPISIDPIHTEEVPIDPQLMDEVIADQSKTSFEQLVKEFGDVGTLPEEDVDEEEEEEEEGEDDDEDEDEAKNDGSTLVSEVVPKRGRPKTKNQAVHVPPEWAATEMTMEEEITEMINDPNTITHATQYAKARRLAAAHVLLAEKANPQKEVSMDVHVGEDEFAQDPEVQNCLLSPADVAMKEKVWINANKDWLRKQQLKEWNKKQAANDPPKAKRNRKKKPRMGEGQTSAANSPAEAAISVLKQRSFSKKINYDAINGLFADIDKMAAKKGDDTGNNGNSRAGSHITELKKQEPSDLSRISSPVPEDDKQSMIDPSLAGGLLLPKKISSRNSASANAARNQRRAEQQARRAEESPTALSVSVKDSTTLASSQKGEDDDYVGLGATQDGTTFEEPVEGGEVESDWKFQLNTVHNPNDFNNSDDIDDEDEDYGDWKADPDPFIDDDLGARGFESDDNVDDYDE